MANNLNNFLEKDFKCLRVNQNAQSQNIQDLHLITKLQTPKTLEKNDSSIDLNEIKQFYNPFGKQTEGKPTETQVFKYLRDYIKISKHLPTTARRFIK